MAGNARSTGEERQGKNAAVEMDGLKGLIGKMSFRQDGLGRGFLRRRKRERERQGRGGDKGGKHSRVERRGKQTVA